MRLIINASNLYGGGGVQVGFSFINECLEFSEHEYHIFLCPKLESQIDFNLFPENFYFYKFTFPPSPSFKGLHIIKELERLEKSINPDCVFSIFGPTYWTPKAVHLMGYAIPHFLYKDSPFYQIISLTEKFKWKLMYFVKRLYFIKNSNYYHVETEDARLRLSKYLNCSIENIFTVSNTYNSIYNTKVTNTLKLLPDREVNEFRFVCISTYYNHKNLEILNKVIPLLKENKMSNIKFILTINRDIYDLIFSEVSKSQIINIGQIKIEQCPQLYKESDAMFLPTLLECFSANYPEAMKMQKPILTSNLSFSKDICGDAAVYFNPLDENDILEKIITFINDKFLRDNLVSNGSMQLNKFVTANNRAQIYLNTCKELVLKTRHN